MDGHYFTTPNVDSAREEVLLRVSGTDLRLQTDRGVFSHGRIDAGTEVLLHRAPEPPGRGNLLDLGCGYGPIALSLALKRKRAQLWAVDVNDRALELVAANAEANKLSNVTALRPEAVPEDVRFAAIYSNPPIRVGKDELHRMLLHWLPRLNPDGNAYLVVQKYLGSDSLQKWLIEQGYPTNRLISQVGYRILHVKPKGSA
ncbi:methyltransferase domain-containing protein [Pseudonocardiaceae bacterium YIM PH 21723]|nr:methyltransferase domain-containing protein [Pseudonocardiaceae bacterium YIM PH 21723]